MYIYERGRVDKTCAKARLRSRHLPVLMQHPHESYAGFKRKSEGGGSEEEKEFESPT